MPLESEQPLISTEFIEERNSSTPSIQNEVERYVRSQEVDIQNLLPSQADTNILLIENEMGRYVPSRGVDIQNLLPSQIETNIRLEERQETTRSQLATFLIKILAGTIAASFAAILLLTAMSGMVDERRAGTFDKNTSLVKDLITFILTAQTGLIGTALGFYFGSRGSSLSD